jgi:HK97 family phage portal protein
MRKNQELTFWQRAVGHAVSAVSKSIPVISRYSEMEWFFRGTTRTLTQVLSRNTVQDPYASHAWVRGAIESVALNISQTPILWKNSRDKIASEADAKPWVKLFDKPNDMMGAQQLFEATIVYLLHFGECIWILDRDTPTAMPREIQPFNGKIFDLIKNKAGKVVAYQTETVNEITGVRELLQFRPYEVCFFKLFNPYDRERGLAPLEAAQLGIDQDTLASNYNKAFFNNSALPGGVIEVEEDLNDEQFNRLKNQFLEHHQGVSKAHMLAVLEGGAKYKQLVPSQKDMEFLNQKKWNRDEILACFKVPKLELGIWDDVNFAVAKVQAREFWVKTLIPKMKLMEWVMYTQLFSVTSTGNVYGEFDTSDVEALQGDLKEKVDMAFILFQMGYPANVLNERFKFNLPQIPNGKASYIVSTVNQVDETGAIKIAVDPNQEAKLKADTENRDKDRAANAEQSDKDRAAAAAKPKPKGE